MGYETKVYFVEPPSLKFNRNFVKVEHEWFYAYSEDNEDFYYLKGIAKLFDKKAYIKIGRYVTRAYARPIASFDLNKVGRISTNTTELFILDSDGNTPMIEDRYGDRLKQLSLHDFIQWVDTKLETREYRALKSCKALAESLIEEYNDVQVLIYGY